VVDEFSQDEDLRPNDERNLINVEEIEELAPSFV
jgi:hypothetical protein